MDPGFRQTPSAVTDRRYKETNYAEVTICLNRSVLCRLLVRVC